MIDERSDEIIQTLEEIKTRLELDFIFQNTIELDDVKNYFIIQNPKTRRLLEKILNVRFVGNIAEKLDLIMRKQIVSLLKAKLEKSS